MGNDPWPEFEWLVAPYHLYVPAVCENLEIDTTALSEDEVLAQIRERTGWALDFLHAKSEHMSAATEQMMEEPPRGTGGPVSTG